VWIRHVPFAAVVALAVCAAGIAARGQQPLPCETPLTEEAIKQLIAAGSPGGRLRQLIGSCGLDLGLADPDRVELRLRQLGIPAAALAALAPPANPAAGAMWMSPFDRGSMVYVASGSGRLGSPPGEPGRDQDETLHDGSVTAGFWIDVAEVSNDAYRRFILSRPEWQKGRAQPEMAGSEYLQNWNGTDYPTGTGSAPVEFVSWHAARAYANWAGKRLPSELEWEFAARAGTATAFWWGDAFDPKQLARANAWGLRDVTGGVWEWTQSLYRPYPYVAADGRESASAPGARVIRGGSRANGGTFLRIANRNAEDPATASSMLGFRCAR
jgi:sulfatase modifying factor 1